ncbi:MAG: hypothetical protein WDA75_00240 [Candidatus Latescibacterota bacterium]
MLVCAVLLTAAPARGQLEVIESVVPNGTAAGLTGSTRVVQGGSVAIYRIGLTDGIGFMNDNDLGHDVLGGAVTNRGVQILIADLSSPTGLSPADFTELRLYRSADAVWDGADVLLATNPVVNIGAATELDVTGLPLGGNRRIGVSPVSTFFIVVASIAPTAVTGHAFTVGALASHVGIYEDIFDSGFGNYLRGSGIVASDGNNVIIGAEEPILLGGGGRTIPFGGEGPLLVLLLTSGLFLLRRRLS